MSISGCKINFIRIEGFESLRMEVLTDCLLKSESKYLAGLELMTKTEISLHILFQCKMYGSLELFMGNPTELL